MTQKMKLENKKLSYEKAISAIMKKRAESYKKHYEFKDDLEKVLVKFDTKVANKKTKVHKLNLRLNTI